MKSPSNAIRKWANWLRLVGRNRRRNDLDRAGDYVDRLESRLVTLQSDLDADRKNLAGQASHAAWMAAKAGKTPDEIADAVRRSVVSDGLPPLSNR